MHHKNIKHMVRKQLKNEFPHWKRLSKKEKRELFDKVLKEVVVEYDFKQAIDAPLEELLAIETQLPAKGIIPLDEMAQFINMLDFRVSRSLTKLIWS